MEKRIYGDLVYDGNGGLIETNFKLGERPVQRGKVRDIYDLGDQLLIVATDRISAFDVVMPNAIPGKGRVLTQLTKFWLQHLSAITPSHYIASNPRIYPKQCRPHSEELEGRSMLVKKAEPLPVECIIRGYLSGSGWKDYQKTGHVCGIALPRGLRESERLENPIFTPSTKAEIGAHDENITLDDLCRLIGKEMAEYLERVSLAIYKYARVLAERKGIIIADTKFEFGIWDTIPILIDEVLTPDSSRFWPADQYEPGAPQPSFDKQFLRDWLEGIGWNKKPPAPELPEEIIEKTRAKYEEALVRLTR